MENNESKEQGVAMIQNSVFAGSILGDKSGQLVDQLMRNISQVENDPKFIPQAESINAQVKSIIEIGKAQIEMVKVQAFIAQK